VRLQEANAGLIAVSEVMRAILSARAAGVAVLGAIGGRYGCFGGMGIAARCCDALVMSEEGRLGLSGPEVIETARGVEEFDSRDRALVWRTVGGKQPLPVRRLQHARYGRHSGVQGCVADTDRGHRAIRLGHCPA
jgi:malonate decarboxylase beta subunit